MSKPNDVPQEVWDATGVNIVTLAHGVDLEYTVRSISARAILSERTRCAEICDAEIALCRQYGVEHIPMIENIKRQVTKGSL